MLSVMCSGLMNQMLHMEKQTQSFLLQKFSQANSLSILKELISGSKKGNMSLINGINFGCQY